MSSYNYPHFENEESDVLSDQDPTKIPWAGDQCGKILIHSTPNVKWGEESFHRGDRALLETVKGWEGGGGWEASFIHFSGIHQPDRWTRILTLELSLAGNIRNTGLYHFWLIKESCKLKKKKKTGPWAGRRLICKTSWVSAKCPSRDVPVTQVRHKMLEWASIWYLWIETQRLWP